jgi:hypothetical protein
MTQSSTIELFSHFEVSPQFLAHLLAEPDYWAPGDFATHDVQGELSYLGTLLGLLPHVQPFQRLSVGLLSLEIYFFSFKFFTTAVLSSFDLVIIEY